MDRTNGSKPLLVVQAIAGSHVCVPWICMEQQVPLFSIGLCQKKVSVHPSVEKKRINRVELVELGLMEAMKTRISKLDLCRLVGFDCSVC
jgi:hypothetical protein